MAIRTISGYKTISKEASLVLANFMPLDLVIKQKAIEFSLKTGVNPVILNLAEQSYGLHPEQYQAPVNFNQLNHPVKRLTVVIQNNPEPDKLTQDINIFTDGSKIDNSVGSAFVAYNAVKVLKEGKFK
jgi:hypothetical protein